MASTRKKQDEKNMKILRDLASTPHNKYCFDCNQRGPTYVNVTIGSFVCTKCSGILRGLTPPHRVKSISMATFTLEEIDLLQNKGNEYCRHTWLGLYEGNLSSDARDEHVVRDFMVDKYEKKRYYLDATVPLTNGVKNTPPPVHSNYKTPALVSRPVKRPVHDKIKKNFLVKNNEFVADFGSADIYNAINTNDDTINNNSSQTFFANFDHFAIRNTTPISNSSVGPSAPSEDRYAALKDLDNALKSQSQTQIDWSSGTNGSSFISPNSVNSSYNSPSSHTALYGSPSQAQFGNSFVSEINISNPFNGSAMGKESGNTANPFKMTSNKMNGLTGNFYSESMFPTSSDSIWMPNPFSVGSTANGHSNNPFL